MLKNMLIARATGFPDFSASGWHSSSGGIQLVTAVALAIFSGVIAQDGWPGSVSAIIPAALLLKLAMGQKGWTLASLALAALSFGACAAVGSEPGPLNLAMAWACLAALALSQEGYGFTNLMNVAAVILGKAMASPARAGKDAAVLRKKRRRRPGGTSNPVWRLAALPLIAGGLFAGLLMTANPVIDHAFASISFAGFFDVLASWGPIVTVAVFFLVWAILRMKAAEPLLAIDVDHAAPGWHHKYFSPGSVAATLFMLNAMFLWENALDFSYIWSGVTLPSGMNYAEYVHRGAYALIVTALMAAGLVILALWPGSRTEAPAPVRWLVYLWIAQNVMLVASSAARTLSYIDAYGMTLTRLSGLVWMALVGLGLVLIGMRVLGKRSNLWLLNRNIAAAFMVLFVSGFVDFRAVVADYNVDRALSQGSRAAELDIDYLQSLGPSALPALSRYANTAMPYYPKWNADPAVSDLTAQLVWQQQDWRRWTLRGWGLQSGS